METTMLTPQAVRNDSHSMLESYVGSSHYDMQGVCEAAQRAYQHRHPEHVLALMAVLASPYTRIVHLERPAMRSVTLSNAKTCTPWDCVSLPSIPEYTMPVVHISPIWFLDSINGVDWIDTHWKRTHTIDTTRFDPWEQVLGHVQVMGTHEFSALCAYVPFVVRARLWSMYDWFVRAACAYAIAGDEERVDKLKRVIDVFHSGNIPVGYIKQSDQTRCFALLVQSQ